MSSNDPVLLNQLLSQRQSEVGQGLSEDEYFELFCSEQILKDEDLSYEELCSGIVDGGGDGGIDSVYFIINGLLYNEDMRASDFKKGVKIDLFLIQSKNTNGFSEAAIEKMISSARDFFDFNKSIESLGAVYNDKVLEKMENFRIFYLELASKFPAVNFIYAYATKGVDIHQNVKRKVDVLKSTIENFINPVSFSFNFITASLLLESARKSPSSTSSLRLAENPISTGQEGFLCLVALKDYFDFIKDENGMLRSYMFEGNVRDYQGKTEVNIEIRKTLEESSNEDFWWLNNGVSIICTDASLSGKILTIRDPEIVNGLQSSREIFNTLSNVDLSHETRNILVRVLKPQSQESRDRIIKATNSQTPIPAASLRATDKIHRDIEDYLFDKGYYYDRRKNYYKNNEKPIKKILGIPFVAQSVMTCALMEPSNARARPSSLIKSDDAYNKIFNPSYNLDVYYKCPIVVQRVSDALRQSGNEDYRKHLNNILFYVAMYCVMQCIGKVRPTINDVANMNLDHMTDDSLLAAAEIVWAEYKRLGGTDKVAKGRELTKILVEYFLTVLKRG